MEPNEIEDIKIHICRLFRTHSIVSIKNDSHLHILQFQNSILIVNLHFHVFLKEDILLFPFRFGFFLVMTKYINLYICILI